MLTPIGDFDLDLDQVLAITDVQENPPEDDVPASYSFEIGLHGNTLGLVTGDREDAEAAHRQVAVGISNPLHTGGVTFDPRALVAVGPVVGDEEDDEGVGFEIFFPGAEVALLYDSEDEAEAARRQVVAAANG